MQRLLIQQAFPETKTAPYREGETTWSSVFFLLMFSLYLLFFCSLGVTIQPHLAVIRQCLFIWGWHEIRFVDDE